MKSRLNQLKNNNDLSDLFERLEREISINMTLAYLLDKIDLPTAKEYTSFNWGDPDFIPYEDADEQRTIELLTEIDNVLGS